MLDSRQCLKRCLTAPNYKITSHILNEDPRRLICIATILPTKDMLEPRKQIQQSSALDMV